MKRILSFCVTRNLAQYELIQQLGEALGIELKRSKDCIELAIYIVHVEGDVHKQDNYTPDIYGILEVRLSPVESV